MNLLDDFREIRKVSTPFCLVCTSDYRATMKALAAVRVKDEVPACVAWDILRGHRGINDGGTLVAQMLGDPTETAQAPAMLLNNAIKQDAVPPNAMIFMVVPGPDMLLDMNVAQGLANLRDVFKSGRRTLVLLSTALTLPSLVKGDMPVMLDPLPDEKEIETIVRKMHADAKSESAKNGSIISDLNEEEVPRAVDMCRGLTRFAVEESISRKIKKTRIDLAGLAEMQRLTVESSTNKALTFLRGKETFADVGGLASFQEYMRLLFNGPRRPKLVVFWDEIDKSITAASAGAVADNTGVSQDQLQVWLKAMNDYKWRGIMSVGAPGTGKSLSALCTGNTFGVRSLAIDTGVGSIDWRSNPAWRTKRSTRRCRIMSVWTCASSRRALDDISIVAETSTSLERWRLISVVLQPVMSSDWMDESSRHMQTRVG